MSLKARLRLLIVLLVALVVLFLSALNIQSYAQTTFDAAMDRAQIAAQQVYSYVVQRVTEQTRLWTPPPTTLEETIQVWRRIVASDSEIASLLNKTAANTKAVIEILITDDKGHVLSASNPMRVGKPAPRLPEFDQWKAQPLYRQLWELLTAKRDYQVPISLGYSDKLVFRIRVVVSGVLLNRMVVPELEKLAVVCLSSLILGLLLAMFVSNLALRPLARISETLDRITKGEVQKEVPEADAGSEELAAVQSKLSVLGQQVAGARQDASQLRGSVDQMLQRLEEAVLLFDHDNRLVMASAAAERILGQGRWLLMGRTLDEVFPASTHLGVAVQSAVTMRQTLRQHSVLLERDDGPPLRLLVNVELLEGFPSREGIGTLVTLRDAESRRQLETHLEISSRLTAINRLTGGVAHEIKNPLNAIALHLEILKSRLEEEMGEAPSEIEVIAREISRLDRVVKTFLDFTRPVDVRMGDVDLVQVAQEVSWLLSGQAAQNHVQVELTSGVETAMIHGDADLIKQAVVNVAVNGVEAMKNGGHLRVETQRDGDGYVLSIADEGPGIPATIRDKIFNLYFTTKKSGTGIGLAMTYRVVQIHNATIEVSSEVGSGTTFRFRFPAVVERTAGIPANGKTVPSPDNKN